MEQRKSNFFMVDNTVFYVGLKPRDIAVYCFLCRMENREKGYAFPTRRHIARACGISKVETVDLALKELVRRDTSVRPLIHIQLKFRFRWRIFKNNSIFSVTKTPCPISSLILYCVCVIFSVTKVTAHQFEECYTDSTMMEVSV